MTKGGHKYREEKNQIIKTVCEHAFEPQKKE